MAIPQKVIKFLEGVKYEPVEHRTVFTAFDKAATLKVPQNTVGKTLIIKADKNFVFTLIGANRNLDKAKFKKVLNAFLKKKQEKPVKNIGFVSEGWMKKNLKGVKLGAVPPFGSLFKFVTLAEGGLMKSPKIIVSAGDYVTSVKISPANLKKLIPDLIVGSFGKAKKK